ALGLAGARHHLPRGMDPERHRKVRELSGAGADAVVDAAKADHRPVQVLGGARIKERPAGGAARAPELAPLLARTGAEVAVELLRLKAAQRLLVEHRDVAPVLRCLEPVAEERGAA